MVEVMCMHCGATWDDALPAAKNKFHGKCLKCGRRTRVVRRSPTDYQFNDVRKYYNSTKGRVEWQIKFGDEWFVYNAVDCTRFDINFLGLFDLAAFNVLMSDQVLRTSRTGAGVITALDELGGACRIATGATTFNEITLQLGDGIDVCYPLNVSQDIFIHTHIRFPNASDINHVYLRAGLYEDADNYIGFYYDPDGVYHVANPNLVLITRSEGVETLTNLLTPVAGAVYEMWASVSTNSFKVVANGGATFEHTTNIPTENLTWRIFLETQEDAVKNIDVYHILLLQDH